MIVIDEGIETFKLKLSGPRGNAFLKDDEAIGTIENDDAMPSAWLSRFGRTVGGQAVDAISSRMGAVYGKPVVIGGVEMLSAEETSEIKQQSFQEPLENNWQTLDDQKEIGINNQNMTLEELAHGTSFNLSGENKSTGSNLVRLGTSLPTTSFEGKADDVDLEGQVTSAFLGADLSSGNWRGGLAVSRSKAEGTFHSLMTNEFCGDMKEK